MFPLCSENHHLIKSSMFHTSWRSGFGCYLHSLVHSFYSPFIPTTTHPPTLARACTHTNLCSVYYLRTFLFSFSSRKTIFNNWKYISQFPQHTELFLTPGGLCQTSLSMLGGPDQLTKKYSNMKSLLSHSGSILPLEDQSCVRF